MLSQGAANRDKIRDNFFLNRTVPLWNDLLVKVKDAKSQWFQGWVGWTKAVLHWRLRVVDGRGGCLYGIYLHLLLNNNFLFYTANLIFFSKIGI